MKAVVVAVLLCVTPAFSQNAKILTLDEAIQIGVQNDTALKISAAKVEGAGARAREANTYLFPSLKLDAAYRRLSDVDPFQVKVPFYPEPIELAPTVLNSYNLRVGLVQPLFTGFRLSSNLRVAESLAEASVQDNRNDREDLVLTIIASYWTLHQTLETQKVVGENVSRLESYVADTEHLLASGLATQNDLLRIQVQLGNARLTRIDAANDVRLAMMYLNNILGQPLDTELAPASSPGESPDSSEGDAGSDAINFRPDVQAMSLRVEAARAGVRAAAANWWPQVFLSGNYYYGRPNARYQPTRDEFKSSWDVGVQLQLDLWNWGATAYQTQQALAALKQSELLYDQLKDNASLEVRRYLLSYQRAQEKIVVARTAVEQAGENLRSTNEKYRTGLATSSDLLDAEVAALQAKTSYTGALVESEISKARWKKAAGKLGER